MRPITHLVVHCTATHPLSTVEAIQRYWREVMGWRSPGYHVIVKASGERVRLAPDERLANGVAGHNTTALHVCYIGGVVTGRRAGEQVPHDTRTPQQRAALIEQLREWRRLYPGAVIVGHRDFLERGKPGWKECPSFDARSEYAAL